MLSSLERGIYIFIYRIKGSRKIKWKKLKGEVETLGVLVAGVYDYDGCYQEYMAISFPASFENWDPKP